MNELTLIITSEVIDLACNCENAQYCYGYVSGRVKELKLSLEEITQIDKVIEVIFESRE